MASLLIHKLNRLSYIWCICICLRVMILPFQKLHFNRLDLLHDAERKPIHTVLLRIRGSHGMYTKASRTSFCRNPLDCVTLRRVVSSTRTTIC